MSKRMLIDATHEEETRVAVIDKDNKLLEYDYESQARKPLKGSIFLAKVTRVEPSLQAAFVNFGGNRHGFLPFSEIHPDYFRIPIADREALMEEQRLAMEKAAAEAEAEDSEDEDEEEAADSETEEEVIEEVGGGEESAASDDNGEQDEEAEEEAEESKGKSKKKAPAKAKKATSKTKKGKKDDAAEAEEEAAQDDADGNVLESEEDIDDNIGNRKPDSDDENDDETSEDADDGNSNDDEDGEDGNRSRRGGRGGRGRYRGRGGRGGRGRGRGNGRGRRGHDSRRVEILGGEEYEDDGRFRFDIRRKYKIQEVIKRGQIMLVQASREERGNKGAAVSTYLSLPGRYCVLMPNSPRGGGVSRKIASYKDRARMREILKELNLPEGMSVIVRTAGVSRTKAEIKRDLDYLMRLWNQIRELTLESSAPAMIYEEADLIKRSVRDLYTRDIEEVVVSGAKGFKATKDFMKLMIPSHVKRVKEDKEEAHPLFQRYQLEHQIAEIGEPTVTLPSGGYLVINPTEALVSVDVNSGRATKERHIEGTALKTNLEAAEEVARQLRLRDLGGLVVIDFIDMEDRRNNGKVERRMKEALSGDRARIQIGRISSFGLMELSRQRLNPSLTEAQFEVCPHCEGIGHVRTVDGMSILVLRAIEEEGTKGRAAQVIVHMTNAVALYILNNKRKLLSEIEAKYNFEVVIRVEDEVGSSFRVEVSKPAGQQDDDGDNQYNDNSVNEGSEEDVRSNRRDGRRDGFDRGRGRGRGRGRRTRDRDDEEFANEDVGSADAPEAYTIEEESAAKEEKKPARRGRKKKEEPVESEEKMSDAAPEEAAAEEEKPKRKSSEAEAKDGKKAAKKAPAKKAAKKTSKKAKDDDVKEAEQPVPSNDSAPEEAKKEDAPKDYETVNEAPDKKRKGWWNRLTD